MRRSRSSPAPSRTRRSACAARACPISGEQGRAATCMFSSMSRSRRSCRRSSASSSRHTPASRARPSAARAASSTSSDWGEVRADPRPGWSSRSKRTSRRSRPSARSSDGWRAAGRRSSPASSSSTRGSARGSIRRDRQSSAGTCPRATQSAAEAAAAEVAEALGHLQAFGLRPIGELRTRIVHEADWAEAWKAYFPVLRVGRRLVIRPTWRRHRARPDDVVLALDPGMAFGTGLHPTTRLCLAALEPLADDGRLADGARSSTSDAARGSWRSPRSSSVPRRHSASTPIRSPSSRRSRTRDGTGSHAGFVRARAAFRPERSPSTSSWPTSSPACSSRWPPHLRDELRPGGTLVASGIFIDREAEVRAAFEAAGLRVVDANGRGRLGRAGRPAVLTARTTARPYDRPDAHQPVPHPARDAHRSSRSACSCRRSCCRSRCAPGARGRLGERARADAAVGPVARHARDRRGPGADRCRAGRDHSGRRSCSSRGCSSRSSSTRQPRARVLHPAAEPAAAGRDHGRGR